MGEVRGLGGGGKEMKAGGGGLGIEMRPMGGFDDSGDHGMSPVLGFLQVFVSGGLKVVLWKAKEELGVDEEIGSLGRECGGSERVGRGGEGDEGGGGGIGDRNATDGRLR